MSKNVTNGHKFGVTGTIFKTSVFQKYISYKYLYAHGLRVTNLTCLGIDPPGRTSQSKRATLSIMPPALSFCIYVIPSLRIDLLNFLRVLSGTWSSDVAWASVMRDWMRRIHGRLWGRITEDYREKEAFPLPPINRLPAIQSLSSTPFKKGVSPPHTISGLRVTGTREGVRGWHGLKVLGESRSTPCPPLPTPNVQKYLDSTLIWAGDARFCVTLDLTCLGIDPPGRTLQSKRATLSIMPPAHKMDLPPFYVFETRMQICHFFYCTKNIFWGASCKLIENLAIINLELLQGFHGTLNVIVTSYQHFHRTRCQNIELCCSTNLTKIDHRFLVSFKVFEKFAL